MRKTNGMMTRLLACLLLLTTAAVSLASCKVQDQAEEAWGTIKDGATDLYDGVKDKITVEQTDDLGEISLFSLYTGTETVEEQDVMVQVIRATVLPESVANKSTTWEVYWMDNQTGDEDAAVTDYVTVTACTESAPYMEQEGSNFCKITCKQAFSGSKVGVRVTTVVGGYTATCEVRYEGRPSHLGIHKALDEGGYEHVTGEILLNTGTTYSFKLVPDNVFHNVGDNFDHYGVAGLSWEGSFVLREGYWNNNQWGYGVTDVTKDASECVEMLNRFCVNSVACRDGNLVITLNNSIRSYDKTSSGQRSVYISGDAILCVTVKETNSGVTQTLRVKITPSVSSVALSDDTLTF